MELQKLVETYRAPLIGLIASWGCPVSEATEIAGDAFSEAYVSRGSMRGDPSDAHAVAGWLRGIARNLYRNWARSRHRRARVLSLETVDGVVDAVAESDEPGDEFARAAEVRRAIERLPKTLRQVVLMHYLEETSVRNVAALLDVPEKTVEGRLYRARQRLRTALDPPRSHESPTTASPFVPPRAEGSDRV